MGGSPARLVAGGSTHGLRRERAPVLPADPARIQKGSDNGQAAARLAARKLSKEERIIFVDGYLALWIFRTTTKIREAIKVVECLLHSPYRWN